MKKTSEIIYNFFPNTKIIKQFELGMSNNTYLIEIDQKKYVFRIPISDNSYFVSHHQEYNNLKKIKSLDINQENILYLKNGIKLAIYIENKNNNFDNNDIINLMKKLHHSNIKLSKYNHLDRLKKYEKININIDPKYFIYKNMFIKKYSFLKKYMKYPCHNDLQQNNLINNKKLYLIDWEFAGMNDYIYDICCYTKRNVNDSIKLLELYQNKKINNNQLLRIYYWSLYQNLQWYLVALYKDNTNFNPNINFKNLANDFLKNANYFYQLIKENNNI